MSPLTRSPQGEFIPHPRVGDVWEIGGIPRTIARVDEQSITVRGYGRWKELSLCSPRGWAYVYSQYHCKLISRGVAMNPLAARPVALVNCEVRHGS